MNRNYSIIPLRPEDYQKCGDIWNLDHPNALRWYEQIRDGSRSVYIYLENRQFLAQGDLVVNHGDRDYVVPGRRICLSRLVVKQSERGRGIGRILLEHLCMIARQKGYSEISLGVNLDNVLARHLYQSCGFTTVLAEGEDSDGKYIKLLKYL